MIKQPKLFSESIRADQQNRRKKPAPKTGGYKLWGYVQIGTPRKCAHKAPTDPQSVQNGHG